MTMSNLVEVKVPDIGDFAEVPIIDLFVKVGDSIKVDDAIARWNRTRRRWMCRARPPASSRKCWFSSAPRLAKASC
jgi:hypothetical protein